MATALPYYGNNESMELSPLQYNSSSSSSEEDDNGDGGVGAGSASSARRGLLRPQFPDTSDHSSDDDNDLVLRSIRSSTLFAGPNAPRLKSKQQTAVLPLQQRLDDTNVLDANVVLLHRGQGLRWIVGIMCLAVAALLVPGVPEELGLKDESGGDRSHKSVVPVMWQCPRAGEAGAATFNGVVPSSAFELEDDDAAWLSRLLASNNTSMDAAATRWTEFRHHTYTTWRNQTFAQVQTALQSWKAQAFGSNLQTGDVMFASACGLGLDLLLTLDVLRLYNVTDLQVYGSDADARSTDLAQQLVSRLSVAEIGSFCTADPTDLSYIPENTFDLVYSASIPDLTDPLNMQGKTNDSSPPDDGGNNLADLCGDPDWKASWLLELAQRQQETWFAKRTSELVRLAKPGKAIIWEHVSMPICTDNANNDGVGGVAPDFWVRAILEEQRWGVDPDSLMFRDDALQPGRYHVLMRKLSLHDDNMLASDTNATELSSGDLNR